MQSARLIKPRVTCGNDFRPGWTYQRLPAGDAMLEQGKGLSPAFFNLLDAVCAVRPVSFADLQSTFPRLHADDLELWLAELCRMKLITPAVHGDDLVPQPRPAQAAAPSIAAFGPVATLTPQLAVAATSTSAAKPACARSATAGKSPAPASFATAFDLDFMPALDFTATGDFAPPVPAGTPTVIEDAIALFAVPPAAQAPTQGVAAALLSLKHKSLDALYDELSAICVELEAREQASAMPA